MFKKAKKTETTPPLPFTLLEGEPSTLQDPQIFKVEGGAVLYRLSLTTDKPDIKLKMLIPVLVELERNGEPLGMINLGTLRLDLMKEELADRLRKMWGTTRTCPETVQLPLHNGTFTVKDVKFNVNLKAEKRR